MQIADPLVESGATHTQAESLDSCSLSVEWDRCSTMPALSPDIGAHLLKATRSQDLDEAFEKVFSEYLALKIAHLERTIDRMEEKWEMDFPTFKRRLAENNLPDEAYAYDVEQDFWKWEEAETLKAHYQEVQAEWT